MNDLSTRIESVQVDSTGSALQVLSMARMNCMKATYHPKGGDALRRHVPITHTVHVEGTAEQISKFKTQLTKRSSND